MHEKVDLLVIILGDWRWGWGTANPFDPQPTSLSVGDFCCLTSTLKVQ